MQPIGAIIKKYFGILIIALAFIVAAGIVMFNNMSLPMVSGSYVAEQGDTITAIASNYGVTPKEIYDLNYPDITPSTVITPGTRISVPRNASGKRTTIMIVHWQVEPGVRESVDFMAREYEKLHPNVRVVQNAMPSQTYGQWFVTQMVGGNPPDLIEVGQGVPYNILIQYYLRYFHPLTEYVSQPNPYNADNEFANVPLKDTMRDGMRTAYVDEVQEYMTVPLSFFMIRLFYNKKLYQKLTGRDTPPKDWREFMAACREIRKQKYVRSSDAATVTKLRKRIDELKSSLSTADAAARASDVNVTVASIQKEIDGIIGRSPNYVPLANTGGYFNMTRQYIIDPVTTTVRYDADLNRDGTTPGDEAYFAMRLKKFDMHHPAYNAAFSMLSNMSATALIEGFIGLNYDDGPLMFVQQRAVFYAMGTWDVSYVQKYANENGFEISVIDFPIPADNDPEFGKFMQGPAQDRASQGFPFACPTPHNAPERKKAAIDFLLFLSSKRNNERLNAQIGWMPSIRNIEAKGILAQFNQRLDGVPGVMNWSAFGGETSIKWNQMYNLFLVGQITYDKLVKDFQPFYLSQSVKDIENWYKNAQLGMQNSEKALAMIRAKAFTAGDSNAREDYFMKYRYSTRRCTGSSLGYYRTRNWMDDIEKNGTASRFNPEYPPYSFTPEALARIKQRR
ncbi:MAG: extracellular solute-binding protein [Spirochaetes bacterium]|nr:extracellular solute-binding protein [Spirochaetota bacterium]